MKYHYTTILHLAFIVDSGRLKRSRRDAHGDHSSGLLWFSENRTMEATALKGSATMVRLASNDCRLKRWKGIAKQAGYSSSVIRRLALQGRKMGGTPSEWWAMDEDLSLDRVTGVDVLMQGRWRALELASLSVSGLGTGVLELVGQGGPVAVVARRRTDEGFYAYATNCRTFVPDNLLGDDNRMQRAG